MTPPTRVLLVDDQSLVRSGFAMILSVEDDIEVVGQASNGQEAIESLATQPADVVLMDVRMPVMDGIEATREIVAAGTARVVVLSTFDDEDYLFDALGAGASGYVLKNAGADDLVEAIRAAARGHARLSPEMTSKVISRLVCAAPCGSVHLPARAPAPRPTPARDASGSQPREDNKVPSARGPSSRSTGSAVGSLSPREREVLGLLADGLSNAEIAAQLFLGESTVKTYVSNVLAKTDSRDRVQAVVFAHRSGLVGQD